MPRPRRRASAVSSRRSSGVTATLTGAAFRRVRGPRATIGSPLIVKCTMEGIGTFLCREATTFGGGCRTRARGPDEGTGIVVVRAEGVADGSDALADAAEGPPADAAAAELGEPALHEVEPGGAVGEVEADQLL